MPAKITGNSILSKSEVYLGEVMNTRKMDGKIRRMQSKSDSKSFFDFEFWGESDEDTYGLLCLTQISEPTHLFITEMSADELLISDISAALETVKSRVSKETGQNDIVFPKIKRFDQKKNNTEFGFQGFLKTYAGAIPIYENVFDNSKEAAQIEKLSIEQFKRFGGKITIVGSLSTL
jgi:hypothetical protein